MKIKSAAAMFGLMTVAVLVSGISSCEKFMEDPEKAFQEETDKTPRYVLTIHELIKYKRADMIETDVDSFFGGTVCVNKNPFIHSRDITKIEMIPRPGNIDFYDLRITLTNRGRMLWSAMAVTPGIGSDPAAAHMTDVNFAWQRVGREGEHAEPDGKSDHGGFDVPGAAQRQQFFGQVAVCHGKMVFPAVVQQFIAQGIAPGVEFHLQRIAPDKQIGVDPFAGGDQHPE